MIVAAVFLYEITVVTGQFEIMKASVARLSADRRLQAVLIAFCFGAFVEGAAGLRRPVAISAAFLVGLGFDPFKAAVLCLLANTAPVAWGSIGIPILTLSKVTGLDVEALSATSGRILPFLSVLVPFWLVRDDDWVARDVRRLAAAGGNRLHLRRRAISLVQFRRIRVSGHCRSGFQRGGRRDLAIHLWKPRETWRFKHDAGTADTALEGRGPTAWGSPGSKHLKRSDRPTDCAGVAALRTADLHRHALGPATRQVPGHARRQGMARRQNLVETGNCPGCI